MSVMGELGEFDVVGIVQLLGMRRATGRLQVAVAGDDIALFLDAGNIVAISSSRLPLQLGRVLQQRGWVSAEQLHDALREQETTGQSCSLGIILVEQGTVPSGKMAQCVEAQSVAILAQVLQATVGSFLWVGGVAMPKRLMAVTLKTDSLLLRAMSRADERNAQRAVLPDADVLLTLADHVAKRSHRDTFDDASLSDAERVVIEALVDGSKSLRELEDVLLLDELALLRAIINLRELRIIISGEHSDRRPDGTRALEWPTLLEIDPAEFAAFPDPEDILSLPATRFG